MIETRSRDESFTLLLHVAVAAALAGVTLLVIITDSWQPIYGGIIVAITLFAVIVQPWTMTTGECFQGLGMFFLVAAPIVASTLINLPEGSHVENIIVLACYAVLAVVLFPEPRDRSMVRFLTLVAITQAVVAVVVVNIILINTDDFLYLIYQGTARQALEFNDVMDANYMGTNYIGMLCTVMVFAAVAFNKLIYRAIFMGLGLALCILVSSRSGMLGVVVAYASGEL